MRKNIIFGISLIILILVFIGLLAHRHHPATQQIKSSDTCGFNSPPCIKLTEGDGTTFKLNDFRLAAGHCIYFTSLPDHVNRHYCGDYKLDWIGPDGSGRGTDV